jgi:pyruvate dehydrogenase E2 component (dihydrolipoamide acetyltransferase)
MTSHSTLVLMPRLSDSMEEGTIVRWLKDDGAKLEPGDELLEIETDKATMVYEVEVAGVLRQLVKEGDTVSLRAPIAEMLGADVNGSRTAQADGAAIGPAKAVAPQDGDARREVVVPLTDRIPASPVARRFAAEQKIELAALAPGSGPRGRIVKRDIEAALAKRGRSLAGEHVAADDTLVGDRIEVVRTMPSREQASSQMVPLTRLQATVARRMAESHATVPDFSVEVEVAVDRLVALRKDLRQHAGDRPYPSYNDFVIKASALALRAHPRVNAAYRDGQVELFEHVNIGVAVAADGTLVVPVVCDADAMSVGAIAAESRRIAEHARAGTLTPPDMSGATFTVSNLGMFGVDSFTAVVNPPQAAILAVGAVLQKPVVRDGELTIGEVMRLTLSVDHRILFGADAAAFLADVRAGLEEPLRLLL